MIVNRFLEKLEPAVGEHGVDSLNGWMFERTHAKKNPSALKWKLSSPRPRKPPEKRVKLLPVIASRFTVKELLHSEGYEVVLWEKMLLVSPKHLEVPNAVPLDGISLNAILCGTRDTLNLLRSDKVNSKETIVKILLLIEQLTQTLKGRTTNADTPADPTNLDRPEKNGPTITRT